MQSQSIQKKALREKIRIKRKGLNTITRSQLNETLLKNALEIIEQKKPKSIAIYFPNDGEADLSHLAEYASFKEITLYLPIIHPLIKRGLWFGEFHYPENLKPNRYGIYEPTFNINQLKAPWEIDLIFMPLVAFDLKGHRLGMGGGFYDYSFQFISKLKTIPLIGCAYEFQKVNQCPNDDWDISVDGILTEKQIYWF